MIQADSGLSGNSGYDHSNDKFNSITFDFTDPKPYDKIILRKWRMYYRGWYR